MSNTVAAVFDRNAVNVTSNKTLTAADSGVVQNVTVDGVVVTLPATANALNFTIKNGGKYDGAVGFTVAPQAADAVAGNGFTAAVNKGAVNAKTVSKAGDEISLEGSGTAGVTAWYCTNVVGTFTRVP